MQILSLFMLGVGGMFALVCYWRGSVNLHLYLAAWHLGQASKLCASQMKRQATLEEKVMNIKIGGSSAYCKQVGSKA